MEYDGKGKLVQSTLYTFMKLSQWNLLVLSKYVNLKKEKSKLIFRGDVYQYLQFTLKHMTNYDKLNYECWDGMQEKLFYIFISYDKMLI
jgi:phosphoribosylaminoimidazole carboxylase (NCAIR synthetase)